MTYASCGSLTFLKIVFMHIFMYIHTMCQHQYDIAVIL